MSIINDVTTNVAKVGMDMAVARQQLIAHNIANANTPGFSPLRMDFGSRVAELRDALTSGPMGKEKIAAIAGTRPVPDIYAEDGSVALDMEVADLSKNTLEFQVISKALSRHFALLSLAITDGRR